MSDIALNFLLANLAAGAAILLVLALRKPVRSAFGACLAYALWLLVPLAALGSLLPPRVVEVVRQTASVLIPDTSGDMAIAAPEVDGAIARPDQNTQSRMPVVSPDMPVRMKEITAPAPISTPASLNCPPKPGTPLRDGATCSTLDPDPDAAARSAVLWQ
jgi:hypothetical protein